MKKNQKPPESDSSNCQVHDPVRMICGCGNEFERPEKYIELSKTYPSAVFKWKIRYCDDCYKKRVDSALKRLPEILNMLAS